MDRSHESVAELMGFTGRKLGHKATDHVGEPTRRRKISRIAIVPGIACAIGPRDHIPYNLADGFASMKKSSPAPCRARRFGDHAACARGCGLVLFPVTRPTHDDAEQ